MRGGERKRLNLLPRNYEPSLSIQLFAIVRPFVAVRCSLARQGKIRHIHRLLPAFQRKANSDNRLLRAGLLDGVER